jgi:hypothetical protein
MVTAYFELNHQSINHHDIFRNWFSFLSTELSSELQGIFWAIFCIDIVFARIVVIVYSHRRRHVLFPAITEMQDSLRPFQHCRSRADYKYSTGTKN